MKQKHATFSEIGQRENNEDYFNVVKNNRRTTYVVCDGMGGHADGQVASRVVGEAFSEGFKKNARLETDAIAFQSTFKAQKAIDDATGDFHMGTTLVMCSVEDDEATIVNCGDSRCYIIDANGNLKFQTVDHNDSDGFVTKCFFSFAGEYADPDVFHVKLAPHDRILVCTDGLYRALEPEQLLKVLHNSADVDEAALVFSAVCKEHATDNYTAIIVEVE